MARTRRTADHPPSHLPRTVSLALPAFSQDASTVAKVLLTLAPSAR